MDSVATRKMYRWILSLLATALAAEAVEVGQTRADVLAELGTPTSTMVVGNRETLTFARGDVVLVDGRVRSVQLRTAEEQAALDYEREQAELARARLEKERAAAREAREAAMIADPALRARPVAEQILVWRKAIESGRVLATSPQVAQHIAALAEALRAEREAEAERTRNAANNLGGVIAPTRLSLPLTETPYVLVDLGLPEPIPPPLLEPRPRRRTSAFPFDPRLADTLPASSLRIRTQLRSLADAAP